MVGGSVMNIKGVDLAYYDKRNSFIIEHFKKTKYPDNVTFVDPTKTYCDDRVCFAVRNGIPLYFDDDHPSIKGAELIIQQIMEAVIPLKQTVVNIAH